MQPLNLQIWSCSGFDCFRLAGGGSGDDIAVRVLFTGGTTASTNTREEMSCGGRGGRHHITHHRLSLCKAADKASYLGLWGLSNHTGRGKIRNKMRRSSYERLLPAQYSHSHSEHSPKAPSPSEKHVEPPQWRILAVAVRSAGLCFIETDGTPLWSHTSRSGHQNRPTNLCPPSGFCLSATSKCSAKSRKPSWKMISKTFHYMQ